MIFDKYHFEPLSHYPTQFQTHSLMNKDYFLIQYFQTEIILFISLFTRFQIVNGNSHKPKQTENEKILRNFNVRELVFPCAAAEVYI